MGSLFENDCVCLMLFVFLVLVPNRGFKTLKSRTRRLQGGFDTPVEPEGFTPSFMKVALIITFLAQETLLY